VKGSAFLEQVIQNIAGFLYELSTRPVKDLLQ
jgi:hypothetical protein